MTRCGQPHRELGSWPTPLVRARRLEARLGSGPLLIKRDDLSGFAVAGSKARPLEYLLGAAIADGHDTLVVGGVATSNFCAAAAVAARTAGLDCHVVLPGQPPLPAAANLALALACGAQVSVSGGPRE
jgi:1-aminocyclopropane-1-carboxylate deaminase/D-cysteine desulfhydrase-like pyridoxal-dependent ACC family enzyme